MTLTEDQQNIYDRLSIWGMSNAKEIVLDAAGGCGKTFLMSFIQQSSWIKGCTAMGNEERSLYFTATTNEATQVMSKMGLDAKTIYSFCGLRPDFRTNEMVARTKPNTERMIVFIDESSYVNDNQYNLIHKQLPNAKIVWVLDNAQLAPVGYEFPVITSKGIPKLELTKVLRSQGELQSLNIYLRDCVINQVNPVFTQSTTDIQLVNGQEYQQLIHQYFNQDWNPSKARMLSYHRDRTKAYNEYLHTSVFGYPEFYAIGSLLRQQGYSNSLRDGDLITVDEAVRTKKDINGAEFEGWLINYEFFIPDEPKKYSSHCFGLKVWNELNSPVNLQHTYANTIHVAQGSTIETVFFDLTDVRHAYNSQREMYRRLVYSGISRASKRVIIRHE